MSTPRQQEFDFGETFRQQKRAPNPHSEVPNIRERSRHELRVLETVQTVGNQFVVGNQPLERQFESLIDYARIARQTKPALDLLEQLSTDHELFSLSLQHMNMAAVNGRLQHTISSLNQTMEEGHLPAKRMRELLEIGWEFDETSRNLDETSIYYARGEAGYIEENVATPDIEFKTHADNLQSTCTKFLPKLKPTWLVGKVSHEDKLKSLDNEKLDESMRYLMYAQLVRSMRRPKEFGLLIETFYYASLHDKLERSISAVSVNRHTTNLEHGKLEKFLRYGIIFNEKTAGYTPAEIKRERDIVEGRYGLDTHVEFPTMAEMVRQLKNPTIDISGFSASPTNVVRAADGTIIRIEDVYDETWLKGIYGGHIKARRRRETSFRERQKRMLDQF